MMRHQTVARAPARYDRWHVSCSACGFETESSQEVCDRIAMLHRQRTHHDEVLVRNLVLGS